MRTLTYKNGVQEFTDTNASYILIGTNLGKFSINKESIERTRLNEFKKASEFISDCNEVE